ncbi:MAG: LysM peptidoglycan-binding domain-containing protein [Rhodoferax sp.]|nr:LysM peptidoglycan-binding domain-containing protein [Betaproteobacteria bacterium]NCN98151.1 LysM peptidoglycan-binding domain-containing protein [Rhodoferax sp.]PIZ21974.1 MAG: peptidoglycan-binding protein [Comamonadaceae bacterium CG_4_10_14_0_8_um_filter_57_29]PJC21338.1 MAG: peptidoglycan-binding protein [Comamonadaceae bacterium CG_4_9_14_0_8_um_filter_57_21]NCP80884.1 LysM peptidoglycan-binding domain-containing protein [Rhodoferax sp.]
MQHTMAKLSLNPVQHHLTLLAVACALVWGPAAAQKYPITPLQRATANQVAQSGVALSELAPNAPPSHTVKSGDTLWAISGLFLKSPWRWPELWGMNLSDIQNPHLIYPGQTLFLVIRDGRAHLSTASDAGGNGSDLPTVRLSPRTRIDQLAAHALPTLNTHLIEPFLAEPMIVGELELNQAPRIVAAQDGRVLLTRGDRAYARGTADAPLLDQPSQKQKAFRVFRNATPLKDPISGEVLGYEALYVGKALLVRSETTQSSTNAAGKTNTDIIPATIDIFDAKEEMRVGDRMLPEPPQQLLSYVPHAPAKPVDARVVSIYGSAVANAAQNQVVSINLGALDGIESGHVLAILKDGARLVDKTDANLQPIKLPDERNGLLMVFRTFERLSYALVLDITSGVKVGDHLVNPN